MKIYERFRSIGEVQRWAVPDGVDSAYFECWGAAGGMPSQLAFEGKKRQVKGGTGPRNIYFYNSPFRIGQLGDSYANNAGYVAGRRDVTEDQVYLIYVGSNGKPGHSTIKLNDNGTSYTVGLRGGEGGWPNGGDGGKGAHIHQNLHDRKSNKVTYKRDTIPPVAKVGQRWWDTSGNQAVYECAERYNNNKSFNVTQKARSSGTATLTIGTHILVVGDHIDITGVDATFNATDKVVTAKTSTTVSYNNAGSNVTTTSASGSVAGPKGVGPSTSNRNWTKVTKEHPHAVGPSGGGGGGATDIRLGGNDLSDRIMVAGGGGGAGGHWNRTGKAKWELRATPDKPNPPFGNDDKGTGATGLDNTWAAKTSYFVGGWGRGGVGGATGPSPQRKITGDGGFATTGGAGGPATDRHEDSTSPDQANGSGGGGGGALAGGSRGTGGTGGSAGSSGTGGSGADATGAPDDFCAGGGGGGGGYWGGGGGGQGFKVAGDNSGVRTRGGGGGGGSNYVHQVFQDVRLVGAARPPSHDPQHEHTGANGYGGFVRISYNKPPDVVWKDAPTAVDSSLASFDASFTYKPAIDGGAKIDHYVVGTAASLSATFPTTQQTVMVSDHSQTEFTRAFTPPSSGGDVAIFVKVVDTDGDESGWLKQKVHGLSASEINHATITSPASGGTFVETATVVWTLGTQTPLIGYRLGISGNKLTDAAVALGTETPWRRGGSRVNLALDPGFAGSTARWFSDANSALVRNDTSFPGVSTKNGKISWALTSDWDAENHTSTWDNLIPGFTYRLHLKIASGLALDPRPVEIQVWDADGFLTSTEVDLSGQLTAGAYVTVDLEFTPHTQGVYFALRPSASEKESEQFTNDFDDGTVQSWVAGASVTQTADNTLAADANSGEYSLKLIGNALDAGSTKDITSLLLGGAGWYVVELYSYTPAAAVSDAKVTINGLGVAATRTGSTSVRDAWAPIRTSFLWDGIGAVVLNLRCDTATAKNYDDITVWTQAGVAESTEAYGNTDSQQVHYLADLLVEQVFEEDGTGAGYPAYFDGAHLNGLTGSVSWAGTANASESYLTGTDILTGDLTWEDFTPLSGGFLYLDTRTQGAAKNGYAGSRATQPVEVNPSVPTMPTVTVTNDQAGGIVSFDIDAGDGAASNKTVSFDILRDGVRIATGLTPDATTRHASYLDFPPTGVAVTYLVRAWDDLGGYRTQSTGTVTVLP